MVGSWKWGRGRGALVVFEPILWGDLRRDGVCGLSRQEAGASEVIFAATNSKGKARSGCYCCDAGTILPAASGVPEAVTQVSALVCPMCYHVLMAKISEPHF